MDHLIGLIQALAWPITVLTIVLLFRREAGSAFERLSHLKYKGLSASFKNSLKKIENIADAVDISKHEVEIDAFTRTETNERLQQLVGISTIGAIMEAWLEVEAAVEEVADKLSISKEDKSQSKLIFQLKKQGILNSEAQTTYDSLHALRNGVVHTSEFTPTISETKRYIELAKGLAAYIRYKANLNNYKL